jgi:hypothetical protein
VYGAAAGLLLLTGSQASALTLLFDDHSGLSGVADVTLVDSQTLHIVLTNTSSNPNYFRNDPAQNLLTSMAFSLPAGVSITGGTAAIGANSRSIAFDTGAYGPGSDVGGEWGYGNRGGTGFGSLHNYVTSMKAGSTPFGGKNLDGPANLSGPQAGLAAPGWIAGGQAGIQSSAEFTLKLSGTVSDLGFLKQGAKVEFGSDGRFVPAVPEPMAFAAFAFGLAIVGGAVRRQRV